MISFPNHFPSYVYPFCILRCRNRPYYISLTSRIVPPLCEVHCRQPVPTKAGPYGTRKNFWKRPMRFFQSCFQSMDHTVHQNQIDENSMELPTEFISLDTSHCCRAQDNDKHRAHMEWNRNIIIMIIKCLLLNNEGWPFRSCTVHAKLARESESAHSSVAAVPFARYFMIQLMGETLM